MRVVVLLAYRDDGAERTRNWAIARAQWEHLGWPIFTGDVGDDPMSIGASVNAAAEAAGDWDVALVTDCDLVLASPEQAHRAVDLAQRTGGYTRAQSLLTYVSAEGVEQVVAGTPVELADATHSIGLTGEKPYAIRRDLWDEIGGYDRRFVGYGAEGVALAAAATGLRDAHRVTGECFHLDHPLVDRDALPHFVANCELGNRYAQATLSELRVLLEEAR